MKNIELMIFDLDGTLVDSKLDLANAVNYALKTLKLPVLKNEVIYGFIGDGIWRLVERALGENHAGKTETGVELFRKYYKKHCVDNTCLYPKVKEMLLHFKNKKKAVVTNKSEIFTRDILQGLKIAGYFDIVYGGDTFEHRKPHPLPLKKVMSKLKIKPAQAIMIGDGLNDVLAAKAAKVTSCAVGYGLEDKKKLLKENPDYFIKNLSQLKKIVN
ncbi:MAG: hypothetical protein A2252_09000 [Elusimicrobia bacterium RIFOXYA2_FULL_39_19]|nr:MAG: hypothetical protein A2252_09000 [Elusimicrobia bacterium RIFOXYA2_FULL_39_19]